MLNAHKAADNLRRDLNAAEMKVRFAELRRATDALERSWERGGVDMDESNDEYIRFCNAAHGVTEIDALWIEPNEDTYEGRCQDRDLAKHKAEINAARAKVLEAYAAEYGPTFIEQYAPRRFTKEDALNAVLAKLAEAA